MWWQGGGADVLLSAGDKRHLRNSDVQQIASLFVERSTIFASTGARHRGCQHGGRERGCVAGRLSDGQSTRLCARSFGVRRADFAAFACQSACARER
jgi:hypothetical protein